MIKNPPANAGATGLIKKSRRSSEEGNGNPLQYSCLGNPWQSSLVDYSPQGHKTVGHNLVTKTTSIH